MKKNLTKNLTTIFMTCIILLSFIGLAQAATDITIRRGVDTGSASFSFTNNDNETVNLTYKIINLAPTTGTPLTEAYFIFTPTTDNIGIGASSTTDMTIQAPASIDLGTYNGTVIVEKVNSTDTVNITLDTVNVIVTENTAPVIISTINDIEAIINTAITPITVNVNDGDGDNVTFDLVNEPTGMTVTKLSNLEAQINWTPSAIVTLTTVTFKVIDENNAEATQTFDVSATESGLHIDIGDINFGDKDQKRENTIEKTITIENTGTDTITGLTVEGIGFDSDYVFTIISNPASTLTAGQSTTTKLSIYIPKEQDSGTEKIGDLRFTYNSDQTVTKEANLITESFLKIDRIKAYVNSDSDGTIDEGDTIDVDVEDEVEIEIKLENTDSDYNFEDGIELTLEIEDLDIDEDEDYNSDLDNDDKSDEITIAFTVPSDEDDGKVDAILTIVGEDENGAEHTIVLEFEFDVSRPRHKIVINSYELLSEQIKQGRTGEIQIDLENVGREDEEDVYVKLKNTELDINKVFGPYDINEGDDLSRTFTYDIPDDADIKQYGIEITVYYDGDEETDSEYAVIEVIQASQTPPTPTPTPTPTTPPIITNPTTPSGNVTYGQPIENNSIFGEDTTLILLIIMVIIVAISVIIIIMIPSKRK